MSRSLKPNGGANRGLSESLLEAHGARVAAAQWDAAQAQTLRIGRELSAHSQADWPERERERERLLNAGGWEEKSDPEQLSKRKDTQKHGG